MEDGGGKVVVKAETELRLSYSFRARTKRACRSVALEVWLNSTGRRPTQANGKGAVRHQISLEHDEHSTHHSSTSASPQDTEVQACRASTSKASDKSHHATSEPAYDTTVEKGRPRTAH